MDGQWAALCLDITVLCLLSLQLMRLKMMQNFLLEAHLWTNIPPISNLVRVLVEMQNFKVVVSIMLHGEVGALLV